MLTKGGITFETMELMAFMNDQPRAAPETVLWLRPLKSAPRLDAFSPWFILVLSEKVVVRGRTYESPYHSHDQSDRCDYGLDLEYACHLAGMHECEWELDKP